MAEKDNKKTDEKKQAKTSNTAGKKSTNSKPAAKKTVAKKTTKTSATKSTANKSAKPAAKKTTTKKSTKTTAKKTAENKTSKDATKKQDSEKTSSKDTSANKLLGIKNAKGGSAKDKKDKLQKKKEQREEALKKKFSGEKSKKSKSKKGFKPFAAIKQLNKKRKIARAAKKEAKPKRPPREIKIMRKRAFGVIFMCVAVAAVFLGGFKIAGALELNAGYAAKTGDTYFKEADVTKYICDQTLYKSYSKSVSQWQQYLSQYGMTPESFRKQVIESKFKHEELVRLCAEQEGVTVDPAEVDKHVESFKNKYSNDANYKKALENAGFTEETYWDHVQETLLERALIERDVHIDKPSDDDVKTYLSSYSAAYKDARKSSHILFSEKDSQKAQEVLTNLKAGSISWDQAVSTYSIDDKTKNQGGNRGWDKIESFSMSYNDALSGLKVDEIYSQLVTDKEGIHIVKCTDKWDTPEKVESLDGIPSDIIEDARQKKYESNQATELVTYLDKFAEENGYETVIYPMPKNVPYYFEASNKGTTINPNSLGGAAGGAAGGTAGGSGTTSVPVQ